MLDTAAALNSGAIHLLRGLAPVDRASGLTPARLSALSVLVFGGPTNLGRLAHAEGVAGPTMTRIVDALVDLGMAARRPSTDDRRVTVIEATERGDALMRAARRRRLEAIADALATLPPAEQDRLATAAALLDEVAQALPGSAPDGG